MLSQHLEIHFIELPKNQLANLEHIKTQLDAWCYYFENEGSIKEDEMTVLLKNTPALGEVHKVYRNFTANDELMDMAEAREKWLKDVNTRLHNAKKEGLEEGLNQGIQQGLNQGIQQGLQEALRRSAQNMLREGLEISLIARITGLSEKEIRELE